MQIITYADNQQCWVFQYGTTTKKSFNCLNSFEYIFKKLHKTPLQGHHCVYTGKENKSHAWHLTAVDEVALTLGMLLHMLQTLFILAPHISYARFSWMPGYREAIEGTVLA